jgi:hypothetical protein
MKKSGWPLPVPCGTFWFALSLPAKVSPKGTIMRTVTIASLLLPAALACSGHDTAPTEAGAEFATACSTPKPKITANPTEVARAPGTTGTAKFVAINNCTVKLAGWTLTSSRTGAVTSVAAPSRSSLPTLSPGQSVNVYVSYRVGSTGSGTVVLLARRAGLTSFGYQGVTVGTS